MSITGVADGPPVRLGVAIADIVSGMFAAQGVAMALLARERTGRGQQVDIAMLDAVGGAAHLPGRHLFRDRHGAGAARQPPPDASCRTRRSRRRTASSCSPSATTSSGAGSARSPGSTPTTSGSRPTASASTGYDELRPFVADRLRTAAAPHWIDGSTRPACRAGRCAICEEVFADPQLAAREMIARCRARDDRARCACSACRSSCRTRRARCARRRRRSASTPTPCCAQRSGLERRRDRQLRARQVSLIVMEISDVRKRILADRSSARSARPPSGAPRNDEAGTRLRRVPRSDRRAAVPAGRQRAARRRLPVQRLHAGGQRPADVGQAADDYIELSLDTTGDDAAGDRPHQPDAAATNERLGAAAESARPVAR